MDTNVAQGQQRRRRRRRVQVRPLPPLCQEPQPGQQGVPGHLQEGVNKQYHGEDKSCVQVRTHSYVFLRRFV
jgi:hypothetical protein